MNDLPQLMLTTVSSSLISDELREEAIDLCTRAFEEDYRPYMDSFVGAMHILGFVDGHLVTHALWITRWLQVGGGRLLRTAYVEAVATESEFRRRGFGQAVMEDVVRQVQDYELGALSPFDANYYEILGWELW